VVIIGDDEAARGIVQLKNMATREQQELSEEQLPSVLASSK
jgi:histidyl-tRNA synthetase